MTVIHFYGWLGDRCGRQIEIDLPPQGCTVAELRALLGKKEDALLHPTIKVCVDDAIVPDTASILPGQSIEFLPPLSGG